VVRSMSQFPNEYFTCTSSTLARLLSDAHTKAIKDKTGAGNHTELTNDPCYLTGGNFKVLYMHANYLCTLKYLFNHSPYSYQVQHLLSIRALCFIAISDLEAFFYRPSLEKLNSASSRLEFPCKQRPEHALRENSQLLLNIYEF
jgi:hypothetical protein